ncbi:MAG: hypothetical protein FIA97_20425 [Methylococcaceae bacterium]|nr:hypothetical protein [Methylococcaceae bacterium]
MGEPTRVSWWMRIPALFLFLTALTIACIVLREAVAVGWASWRWPFDTLPGCIAFLFAAVLSGVSGYIALTGTHPSQVFPDFPTDDELRRQGHGINGARLWPYMIHRIPPLAFGVVNGAFLVVRADGTYRDGFVIGAVGAVLLGLAGFLQPVPLRRFVQPVRGLDWRLLTKEVERAAIGPAPLRLTLIQAALTLIWAGAIMSVAAGERPG